MISKFAFLETFLLASSALAVHPSQPRAPLSYTGPNSRPPTFPKPPSYGDADEPSEIRWNTAFAGSMLNGEFFDSMTGTFTVPTLKGNDGIVLISVGIDNGGCESGSLGVSIQGQISNNRVSWNAWCQWLPEPRIDLQATMRAGDVITLTISVFNTTMGVVMLENKRTGHIKPYEFNKADSNSLCMMSAGWFVEAVRDKRGTRVPLAEFGSVTFTVAMATASRSNDMTYFPSGSSAYDLYSIEFDEFNGLTTVELDGYDLVVQYGR